MTLRLHSMQIRPRGSDGLGTHVLQFGRLTTLLFGPNGSGKTPVLRALEYVLGHPVELPPLLRVKCRSIILVLTDGINEYTIERILFDGVDVRVHGPLGQNWTFDTESAYSEWLLPLLGPSIKTFMTKSGDPSKPYMSLVGPIFFVDQDTGWTQPYAPLEKYHFLKDQREEMVRWVTGLLPRNRPIDRKAFADAKVDLESIQERIAIKRQTLLSLNRELGEDKNTNTTEWLIERSDAIRQQLENLYSVSSAITQATASFDSDIHTLSSRRDSIQFMISNSIRRLKQISDARDELSTELMAQADNEVAADAFRSLCGNENCQFFRNPEESYGKRVLYLKDQMKDFEFTSGALSTEVTQLQEEFFAIDNALKEANQKKTNALAGTDGERVSSLIESLSRELVDVSVRRDRIERVEREKEQLHALLDKEGKASDRVSELKPTAKGPRDKGPLSDVQQHLTNAFREWVQILGTKNLTPNILFDENLNLLLDGTPLTSSSHYSGSTRTRLILAYHAALVETSIKVGGQHPGFIVLDAPKQHELSPEDFKAYTIKFYEMSSKLGSPIQLIFSTSDSALADLKSTDKTWEPEFNSPDGMQYLGIIQHE